jgi:hypothetical protein
MKFTIFGREPSLWLGLFSAALQMVVTFWLPLSIEQTATVNAVAAAVVGLVVAWATRAADGGSSVQAAVLGAAQAILTLALAFGAHLAEAQTTVIMSFIAVTVAAFVRQNVSPRDKFGLAA